MKCVYMITVDGEPIAHNLDDKLLVEWLNENNLEWLFDTSEKDASFERSDLITFNEKLAGEGVMIWANN